MKRSIGASLVGVGLLGGAAPAHANYWEDATAACLGTTAGWTSKVELGDVDGDTLPDIILANGGDYASGGTPELTQIFRNTGDWDGPGPACEDITAEVLGAEPGLVRSAKLADVDGDGDQDLFLAGAWHTASRLIRRDLDGWTDISDGLPAGVLSVGDAEFGDVDDDGDLDLVLADAGADDPFDGGYQGGRVRLWLGDGDGGFTDATSTNMPTDLVAWSWDLEVVDVTGDFQPDVLVSCKLCDGSVVYGNSHGVFSPLAGAIPAASNNYEFEAMDVDGDGDLDLATINDGGGLKDRLLINSGFGTFLDQTAARLAGAANPGEDDNVVVFGDVDADGDPDLLTGSLSGLDRLALNDGAGVFTPATDVAPDDTPGTLGLGITDLDGDGRLDLVQGQGEVAFDDKVQLATAMVAIDTAAPRFVVQQLDVDQILFEGPHVHALILDGRSPSHPSDLAGATVEVNGTPTPMTWYAAHGWVARDLGIDAFDSYRVCATDRAGNQACSEDHTVEAFRGDDLPWWEPDATTPDAGDDDAPADDKGGGCCDARTPGAGGGALLLAAIVSAGLRRRRRR